MIETRWLAPFWQLLEAVSRKWRLPRAYDRDTRALTRKRMETVDEEFICAALDFMERKTKEGAPWFCYFNATRMHVFTHLKEASKGKTGLGLYPDGVVELDGYVGQLLQRLDDLGARPKNRVTALQRCRPRRVPSTHGAGYIE